MGRKNRHRAFLVVFALALLAAGPAAADTYQVDRTDDSIHTGCDPFTYPDCSLRGAIIKANNHPGTDIVQLGAHTYTLAIAGADEDFCQTGDLDVQDTLVIEGKGPERTVINAAGIDRVLHMLASGKRLTVKGVTLTGGNSRLQGGGGVLSSQGGLRLEACVVTANHAPNGDGGGICDYSSDTTLGVQVLDTWVTGNTAHGCGGVHSTSRLLLQRSTVSTNTSTELYPAVNVFGANSVLDNCTISHNTAPTHTGGVEIWADAVTISSCTLAGNSGYDLTNSDPYGTHLANNLIVGACGDTAFTSLGGNLESPGNTCNLGGSDLVNVANPMLSGLGWFGGPSPVHRPLPGSPAIDRTIATANCPLEDQRRQPRPRDGGGGPAAVCDIGAVELAGAGEIFVETFESGFLTPWSAAVW